jgi:CRP-like cAMP-binding protein
LPPSPSPRQNLILATLPEQDYGRLLPHLDLVEMPLGHSVYESGGPLEHVYFPVEGIVSLVYVTEAGESAELAMVGNDGMIGVSLFMGGEAPLNRAVVQSACRAYRLSARILKEHFTQGGALQLTLLRYTQALIAQISQTAVCNLHHSVDEQLCRWLLLSLDRLPGNEVRMTQVRRQGVTESARRLEQKGVIHYSRGVITVLDRAALERHACHCYATVKHETDRLLPHPAIKKA